MLGIARDGVVPGRDINAAIGQLGGRETDVPEVSCSIQGLVTFSHLLHVIDLGLRPDGRRFLAQSPWKVSSPRPSDLGPVVASARPARKGLPGGLGAAGGKPEPIRGTRVRPPGAPDCLSTCLGVCCLSVCLSVCLCVFLSVCMSVCLSVCPSVFLSVSVCLAFCFFPACLSVCLCRIQRS